MAGSWRFPSRRSVVFMSSSTSLTLAAVQMAMGPDRIANIDRAERLVREAAAGGANVILLPELFEGEYFCKDQLPEHLERAEPLEKNLALERFSGVARELRVVLPISVYERSNQALFNTVVMIDADGKQLGKYRKSHIPDGPGYTEKYYFSPGDTGFMVWETTFARIGVGICWDQWFPEAARCMALAGAEVLLYPTAIGTEPPNPKWDSSQHWQRVMQGHAGANLMPVVAANRIGHEVGKNTEITFYGSSFIADNTGAKVVEMDRVSEGVISASFDRTEMENIRNSWGLFRDRRPDLYRGLTTLDGHVN